jgi:hypothetical protein
MLKNFVRAFLYPVIRHNFCTLAWS